MKKSELQKFLAQYDKQKGPIRKVFSVRHPSMKALYMLIHAAGENDEIDDYLIVNSLCDKFDVSDLSCTSESHKTFVNIISKILTDLPRKTTLSIDQNVSSKNERDLPKKNNQLDLDKPSDARDFFITTIIYLQKVGFVKESVLSFSDINNILKSKNSSINAIFLMVCQYYYSDKKTGIFAQKNVFVKDIVALFIDLPLFFNMFSYLSSMELLTTDNINKIKQHKNQLLLYNMLVGVRHLHHSSRIEDRLTSENLAEILSVTNKEEYGVSALSELLHNYGLNMALPVNVIIRKYDGGFIDTLPGGNFEREDNEKMSVQETNIDEAIMALSSGKNEANSEDPQVSLESNTDFKSTYRVRFQMAGKDVLPEKNCIFEYGTIPDSNDSFYNYSTPSL